MRGRGSRISLRFIRATSYEDASPPRRELGAERKAAGPATGTGRGQESALLLLLVEIGAIEHGPHLLLKQIVQRYGAIGDGIVLVRYRRRARFSPLHRFGGRLPHLHGSPPLAPP